MTVVCKEHKITEYIKIFSVQWMFVCLVRQLMILNFGINPAVRPTNDFPRLYMFDTD